MRISVLVEIGSTVPGGVNNARRAFSCCTINNIALRSAWSSVPVTCAAITAVGIGFSLCYVPIAGVPELFQSMPGPGLDVGKPEMCRTFPLAPVPAPSGLISATPAVLIVVINRR